MLLFSYSALLLAGLGIASAQPAHHAHDKIHKRQDWTDPNIYAGVDWSKVNYGGGAASTPAAQAPAPAADSPESVAVKENVVAKTSSTPPAASPSPSSAPTTNTNTASTGGGKRGLAYNDASLLSAFGGDSKCTWSYNWGATAGGSQPKQEYVPMLHDLSSVGAWAGAVKGQQASHLLAFNEPDMMPSGGGSNIDPQTAATSWMTNMQPFAGSAKLSSPAVSAASGINKDTGRVQGQEWLSQFNSHCSGCDISFVAVHWYGAPAGSGSKDADFSEFQTYISNVTSHAINPKTGANVPIWLTEFQSFNDPSGFLQLALPWLDSQPAIERYAYQMVQAGELVNGNSLSALGQVYATT